MKFVIVLALAFTCVLVSSSSPRIKWKPSPQMVRKWESLSALRVARQQVERFVPAVQRRMARFAPNPPSFRRRVVTPETTTKVQIISTTDRIDDEFGTLEEDFEDVYAEASKWLAAGTPLTTAMPNNTAAPRIKRQANKSQGSNSQKSGTTTQRVPLLVQEIPTTTATPIITSLEDRQFLARPTPTFLAYGLEAFSNHLNRQLYLSKCTGDLSRIANPPVLVRCVEFLVLVEPTKLANIADFIQMPINYNARSRLQLPTFSNLPSFEAHLEGQDILRPDPYADMNDQEDLTEGGQL